MKKLVLFLSFLMILSCSSDDNQCEGYKDITNDTKKITFCENLIPDRLKSSKTRSQFPFLIKDEERLNSLFSFDCDVSNSVDFQKYDLIIGFEPFMTNQYKFYKKCDENKFILEFTFEISDGLQKANVPSYGYSILVEKGIVKSKEEIRVIYNIIKEKS